MSHSPSPAPNTSNTANPPKASEHSSATAPGSNFLRHIIETDLAQGKYSQRLYAGQPDPAKIRTRFPPEPNGYLHIGHAKSICINFGLAADYGGVCHLRYDDTNPEKENQEYVDAIADAVSWLGFSWTAQSPEHGAQEHRYFASAYFDQMYRFAQHLIEKGWAYVDEQSPEDMRRTRGDFNTPGTPSPYRERSSSENLARFAAMKAGQLAEGAAVLRAKIDMAHPNINMRDPALYRIKHASHHHTGTTWCIYPMYTYAHPIEDALENITHSLCTLEFEDQRPFYDWLLGHLCADGLLPSPPPQQYEFARLNLSYVVTSKRKLAQLVSEGHVQGWDDPRLPTIAGLRRRGYTPSALRLFCERIGVSKAEGWIDYSTLEGCLREDLENQAPRAMAVLDPICLRLDNWHECMGEASTDACHAPAHPQRPELGTRQFQFGPKLWIERSDFEAVPPKGYHRLYPPHTGADGTLRPGSMVRLKYGHVVECTGMEADAEGRVHTVHARIVPDTKSGTPGADAIKVKGVITWVSADDALPAEIRLYDRLFTQAQPDAGGQDFLVHINPHSLHTVQAYVEPSLAQAETEDSYQFERHGYFVADRVLHKKGQTLVFNRSTGLKDSWGKQQPGAKAQ